MGVAVAVGTEVGITSVVSVGAKVGLLVAVKGGRGVAETEAFCRDVAPPEQAVNKIIGIGNTIFRTFIREFSNSLPFLRDRLAFIYCSRLDGNKAASSNHRASLSSHPIIVQSTFTGKTTKPS